tara:strand:+ start:2623 stop:2871 length:249 start_codon:yes stop_codon:yes gene_type:complete
MIPAGEDIQMNMAEKAMVTEKEYFEMVRKKTGALIAAPAASGAIVGGASVSGSRILRRSCKPSPTLIRLESLNSSSNQIQTH